MEHSSATRVSGTIWDSLKHRFGGIDTSTSSHYPADPLRHSQLFSIPSWSRVLQSEALLRRAIPLLIVTLLVLVAAARGVAMLSNASQTEGNAKQVIATSSELAALYLASNPVLEAALKSPTLAEAFLKDAMPSDFSTQGRTAYLVDGEKKIVASTAQDALYIGVQLKRVLNGHYLLEASAEDAGVQTFDLDGKHTVIGSYRRLVDSTQNAIGGLLIVQTHDALFSIWRNSLKLNIILFLATSTVMLVILYAYFSQGARAREADAVFMENSARFDTALARGHCGLWDWDLARGRIVWSRSMFELLGMEATDRVIGYAELSGMLHADDPDIAMLANSAFNSSKRQIDHRFRIMHSSGTWVWMRMRAELVWYKGADPHLIGIAVDISEQEAFKRKSRDADIRLHDAIENISEAFVLWDAKKRLVMCNSKYQQLYNLPASGVVTGTPYAEVMKQSRKPRIRTQVATTPALENGSKTFEAQIQDGSWLQINERRTQDGGFVSVGTDITLIKRNEAKLVESEGKLKATIADLRASQRKLEYQAQKLVELADDLSEQKNKAEAGSRAKSEFLANISHELRTPLNAIIGFSEIMRNTMFGPLGSEKYEEYAEDIHHSGSFLLGVINDVLDMSKIEAGQFELNPETVDLNELLNESMRIIHFQSEQAELSVQQRIPNALTVTADRRAVKQILINLLSNAVKFTPNGGKITVSARKTKSSISILIADNGIGISPEALKRLGKPFEQVQDQFTKDHKGSGLGLAIARSLAQLHGGSLKIKSVEGDGTRVSVRLPIECQASLELEEDEEIAA